MRQLLTKGAVTILIILLVFVSAGLGFLTSPTEARAQGEGFIAGAAGCAAGALAQYALGQITGAISGVLVPTKDPANDLKEQFLDCLAWAAMTVLIQEITDSVIAWAQSGFDGNPAFVDNFDGWLEDIAKREVDLYLNELNTQYGGLICAPFRRPIVEAIIRIHSESRFERSIQCTLDDVIANVEDLEAYLSGDFSKGGWDAWINLTNNNPYTDFASANAELDRRIEAALHKEETQALWGRGFLSWESQECYDEEVVTENGDTVVYTSCDAPQTNTPGSVIEDQLNEQLGSGQRRIEAADEINEMISALMYYLILDILSDDEGLRGYSGGGRERDIIYPEIPTPPTTGGGPTENPSGGTPGEEILETRNGVFLSSSQGSSRTEVNIQIPEGIIYDTVAIDFDVNAPSFPGQAFHGIFDVTNPGSRGRYFAVQANLRNSASRGIRTLVDNLAGAFYQTRNNVWEDVRTGGADLHIETVYDTIANQITVEITNNDTGRTDRLTGNTTEQGTSLVEENDIRDMGSGLVVGFGLDKTYDNGGYYPTYGWTYRNLEVVVSSDQLQELRDVRNEGP